MGKDVLIQAPTAEAFGRAGDENIQHNCPLCKRSMPFDEFKAHAEACIAAHPEKVAEIEGRTR